MPGLPPSIFIAAGHEQSLSIDREGGLWSLSGSPKKLFRETAARFIDCDGGVRHAAAVTSEGSCLCWGKHGLEIGQEGRSGDAFCEAVPSDEEPSLVRWWPTDGAKLVQVACGWR